MAALRAALWKKAFSPYALDVDQMTKILADPTGDHSTVITHHPRTRTARHPAHHGTLACITTHTHLRPPLFIPCRTVCAMAMELGLHPGDHHLLIFKVHTLDGSSFDVGEGNGPRFRAHNLWRMQWGPQ